MKARIKATGDVVEISLSHIVYDGDKKIIWYNTPQGAYFTEDELEFIDTEENFDYWTHLEHQAAIAAMQGMLANPAFPKYSQDGYYKKNIVNNAYEYAHVLVEKYKKEERK